MDLCSFDVPFHLSQTEDATVTNRINPESIFLDSLEIWAFEENSESA